MSNPARKTDTQKGQTLLKGHALLHEGTPYTKPGSMGPGRAQCQCGLTSPCFISTAARKQWHRDHKQKMREKLA